MNIAKRTLCAALAAALLVNALSMLLAGGWWYGAVAGVKETGPFNAHFVMDIGAVYLVTAAALIWRSFFWSARRGTLGDGAVIAAAAFLDLHAMIHVAHAANGGPFAPEFARDFPGVYLPAILATWIAWPTGAPPENGANLR